MRRKSLDLTARTRGSERTGGLVQSPVLPEPERLVGLGFRYWMLGRKTGNVHHWERTWGLYCGVFGLCGARLAVGNLSAWVNTLCTATQRDIEVCPARCSELCRDECIAVSMIAACQHNTCPALRACAFALIESSSIDRAVGEAQQFAATMDGLEQRLSYASIISIAATVPAANRLPA